MRLGGGHRPGATPFGLRTSIFGLLSVFGVRPSAFFRFSAFGCRVSFAIGLLPSVRLLAAANDPALDEAVPALPHPPHAEIPPTFWEQYAFWIVILSLLLLLVLAAVVWWLARPKPPVIELPAVRARHDLEPLREQPENGVVLSRVSQVLRHYFAGAFSLPQQEMTTTEFCRLISGSEQVGPELSAGMGDFLRECDRRKFAPLPVQPPLGAVAQAAKLIEQGEARRAKLLEDEAAEAARARAAASGSTVRAAPAK
jgi:hypothetical protein